MSGDGVSKKGRTKQKVVSMDEELDAASRAKATSLGLDFNKFIRAALRLVTGTTEFDKEMKRLGEEERKRPSRRKQKPPPDNG